MIVSEKTARSMWCPMVRRPHMDDEDAGSNGLCAINTGAIRALHADNCIASRCMMWRERGADEEGQPQGYCGLAGTVL